MGRPSIVQYIPNINPFDNKFNKVNSIVTLVLFIYCIIQLICLAAKIDLPKSSDNIINGLSFIFTIIGYSVSIYYYRHREKVYVAEFIGVNSR